MRRYSSPIFIIFAKTANLLFERTKHSGFGINKITEIYGRSAFKITDNFITVILPFNTEVMSATTKTISDAENKILNIIMDNPSISAKAIALKLSITEDGVRYHIKKLKKTGFD